MNELFGDPERPPTDAEMRRVNLEFHKCHQAFLERKSSFKSPHTIERGDLASRVASRFDGSYRSMPDLRIYVCTQGMLAMRVHWMWGQWLSWEISDQWLRHYGAMPRLTTYPQNAWMRLASLRADGYLFPIVGNKVTDKEMQLLKSLETANKVYAVPTEEGVGVWSEHPTLGTMTLRPSDQRRGGDDDLEFLFKRGYFEKLPTRDPLMRWRTEENVMVTLRLTQMGRDYINALASGALIVPTDAVTPGDGDDVPDDDSDDEGQDIPGDTHGAESRVEETRFHAWRKGKSLHEILVAAVATGVIENPLDGLIYWMRRSEDPPRFTLEEVAEQVGLSKSEVQRRQIKCADSLEVTPILPKVPPRIEKDPEERRNFLETFQQNRERRSLDREKVWQNLAKIREYLDRNTNA